MARWGLAATGGIIALIAIFIGGEKPPTGTKPAPGASFVDAAAAPGQHSAMEQPQIKGGETYAEYENSDNKDTICGNILKNLIMPISNSKTRKIGPKASIKIYNYLCNKN